MPNLFDADFADRAFDGFKRTQGTAAEIQPGGSGGVTAVTGTWEPWAEADEFDTTGKRVTKRGVYVVDPAAVPAWSPDVLDSVYIPDVATGVRYEVERIAQTLPVVVLHLIEFDQRRIHGRNTYKDR